MDKSTKVFLDQVATDLAEIVKGTGVEVTQELMETTMINRLNRNNEIMRNKKVKAEMGKQVYHLIHLTS